MQIRSEVNAQIHVTAIELQPRGQLFDRLQGMIYNLFGTGILDQGNPDLFFDVTGQKYVINDVPEQAFPNIGIKLFSRNGPPLLGMGEFAVFNPTWNYRFLPKPLQIHGEQVFAENGFTGARRAENELQGWNTPPCVLLNSRHCSIEYSFECAIDFITISYRLLIDTVKSSLNFDSDSIIARGNTMTSFEIYTKESLDGRRGHKVIMI